MWDPDHLEAGLRSLSSYDLDDFHDEFRDFHEAIMDPKGYVGDSAMDEDTAVVNKVIRFRDEQVLDVSDVVVEYHRDTGEEKVAGSYPSWPLFEQLMLHLPKMEVVDEFVYEEEMEDIVVSHVMAQIRDIYLNMGEEPPREYQVEGIGKLDIHGDGVGET